MSQDVVHDDDCIKYYNCFFKFAAHLIPLYVMLVL